VGPIWFPERSAMKLKINTKYYSKVDNIVDIYKEETLDDAEGHPYKLFTGKVVKAVKGHEVLVGRLHQFIEDGKWLNDFGETVPNCLHDIREETPFDGVDEFPDDAPQKEDPEE
jgi:hypothetical protein